jgi:rhodanese-related sulfurtransferase
MLAQIRPGALAAWISEVQPQGQALVLDVREPWEVQTASVKPDGFELRAIPMNVLGARLHELDRSQPIACLCHHGARSMQVANFLIHQGFACVANISGGINAWAQELDSSVPRY